MKPPNATGKQTARIGLSKKMAGSCRCEARRLHGLVIFPRGGVQSRSGCDALEDQSSTTGRLVQRIVRVLGLVGSDVWSRQWYPVLGTVQPCPRLLFRTSPDGRGWLQREELPGFKDTQKKPRPSQVCVRCLNYSLFFHADARGYYV